MPIIRSLWTAVAASGLPMERGGSSVVGRGRSNRTDQDQRHCYHHVPTCRHDEGSLLTTATSLTSSTFCSMTLLSLAWLCVSIYHVTFFWVLRREWTILDLDTSRQGADLVVLTLVLLFVARPWSRKAMCHTLAFCGGRTAWRWSAILAPNGDGWQSLCGTESLISTVSWFGICSTISY